MTAKNRGGVVAVSDDAVTNEATVTNESLTRIPQEIELKPAFVERYKLLLGDRYDEFLQYSMAYLTKCVRVNTLKSTVSEVKKRLEGSWKLTPVPWCKEGFWIEKHGDEERFDIGNLVEHQLGYLYVQEAASMIPPVLLDPRPGERVLDFCAAPGSKTTQVAAFMENTGLLFANDVDAKRLKPLGLNLQRCGVTNCVVTLRANKRFERESFDKVLVDAPCTGTGTIRKSLKTMRMWSPGLVEKMRHVQQQLASHAFSLLKPGGVMVYSTCTLEPAEDEAVVSWLLDERPEAELLDIKLDIKRSDPITEWNGTTYHKDIKKVLRIYPQDNDSEGFFVAKIRKKTQ